MFVTVLLWSALLTFPAAVAATAVLAAARRPLRWGRRFIVASLVAGALPTLSLVWTLATDDESVLASGANWARNHGLGRLVDEVERRRYDEPPSTVPADELALAPELTDILIPVPAPGPATSSPPITSPPATSPVGVSVTTTTTTSTTVAATTTTTVPFRPSDLVPVVEPPLEGEGVWTALVEPGSPVEVWVTSFRPFAEQGSVTATAVLIEPEGAEFVLHNGTELPGGDGWRHGPRIDDDRLTSVVAAFNGGFRFEHIEGGYVTEGRVVEPLAEGEASLAIDTDGRLHLGLWGRDLVDDGRWRSVRQSLPPIVDGGVNATLGTWSEAWGVDFGNEIFVFRSAICARSDGRFVYVAAADVDVTMLADILIGLGCDFAMQLDINGDWPQFAWFTGFGTDERAPVLIDARMGASMRYLNGSKKDFVAVYAAEP